jgi:hypothetical protein
MNRTSKGKKSLESRSSTGEPSPPRQSDSGLISQEELKAYETGVRSAHRALLVLCVVSAVCLGLARTPSLVAEKLPSPGGFEFKAQGIPAASFAVVLGPLLMAMLTQWCYRAVTRSIGFRTALTAGGAAATGTPEDERLALPLLGSPTALRSSRVARCEIVFLLSLVGIGPLICGIMLLWDYSSQFRFSQQEFNSPGGLWLHWPHGVLRPNTFNGIASSYHPSLLPPWQPWLYLALLIWSAILICDMYRLLGVWKSLKRQQNK